MKTIEYEKLTIYEVEKLHKDLVQWCDQNNTDKLILDFTNVHKIDLAGIQLLLSAKKSCEELQKSLILINVKSEVKKSLIFTAVEKYLLEAEHD